MVYQANLVISVCNNSLVYMGTSFFRLYENNTTSFNNTTCLTCTKKEKKNLENYFINGVMERL